ncbi:MAG TPA: glutamate--tRNA ligase [Nitrospirales bacterium]|nr:glutamate--tRNA ligase [Nitrospirales bacterium]
MHAPRLRFAPSPTGYLHIGGVRTALFNWLLARRFGGTFILRIEDTDKSRSTDESIQAILKGLTWLGITPDESPYRQTERLDAYREQVDRLLAEDKAYRCVCTPEELDEKRKIALKKKETPKYDGRCRDRPDVPEAQPFTVRFRSPTDGDTVVKDLIKGEVTFNNSVLDDLVIVRQDGLPTYNFSVVVDDALMGITHVLRGDDHLNNTPRQIHIYKALGFPLPEFGHLPMILGQDKSRLSKRHGATSITAYEDMGYLPEAMINYLVRLGWSHGDQEIFLVQELTEVFALDHAMKSAAVFDPDKLSWVNSQHLQAADPDRIAKLLRPLLVREGIIADETSLNGAWMRKLVVALQTRWRTLVEMAHAAAVYIRTEIEIDEQAKVKFLKPAIKPALESLAITLQTVSPFTHDKIEPVFQQVLEKHELKMGKLAQPVRVALTGGTASPGIYDVMELLGQEKTCERLTKAAGLIPSSEPA